MRVSLADIYKVCLYAYYDKHKESNKDVTDMTWYDYVCASTTVENEDISSIEDLRWPAACLLEFDAEATVNIAIEYLAKFARDTNV